MRGIQVSFAFVVALLIMSGVFYGVWYYSVNQIIDELPKILKQTFPGKVKYSKVDTVFHPFHSKLRLLDTSISMLDPKTGGSVIIKLGDLDLMTKPFDFRKVQVVLPENMNMTTTYQGRSHEYRTTFIDPVLEWVKKEDGYDISLSVGGVLVKGRQNGYFANLIKVGYSYLAYDTERDEWSSVLNNLDLNRIAPFYRWPLITSTSFTFQPKGAQSFPSGYFLAASGAQDKVAFDTMVMNYLKNFALFSQLDISEFRVVVDDTWYSYQGPISVNDKLYLQLNGSLSSNKFATMMTGVENMMGGFPLALERMLERIDVDENRTQTVFISTNDKILNVNGAPVGKMPTLPEQFNLHGRGER
jgi:hypothetical protein